MPFRLNSHSRSKSEVSAILRMMRLTSSSREIADFGSPGARYHQKAKDSAIHRPNAHAYDIGPEPRGPSSCSPCTSFAVSQGISPKGRLTMSPIEKQSIMAANKTATIKSFLTMVTHLSDSELGRADGGHVPTGVDEHSGDGSGDASHGHESGGGSPRLPSKTSLPLF
ncbi:hypothetical protein Cgig2_019026 [Carnegiea gigantea]|uniref:Uncharacterized protein n=1 Tax=Carnegiea gigantea TaxID=171969 RepID=A0A9Q1JPQ3_9CARY|nr:hypothetical protein Cgig2_019026 [Carnegiea gigantea]